ncbi:MAG: N4-(beta-N-acetylglucosaminyl)-L-asparaginase [Candidatus Paceibacteria bacterium]|jgi:N4-(beta-N-acetylglucosaminyl)-L-asparaginase
MGAGLVALGCNATAAKQPIQGATARPKGLPVLVGSANALAGMKISYDALLKGAHPLDVAIDVVKVVEANPNDHSVGLGGLPNEDGVVQLDAAVMDGRTHNAGSVGCIENILHPCEVARLVMERTDHCMIVGPGAYKFARGHGHPHTELLTDAARQIWLRWKESMSDRDDRFEKPPEPEDEKQGMRATGKADEPQLAGEVEERITGTIHCSALSVDGEVACTTTTSGLSWKIPGRVGDSPIIGAGLYCDGEAGSAGATGRGEAAILSHGSSAIVELLRQGAAPVEAGLELMARVTRQAQRASAWQKGLVDENGVPTFNLSYYILGLDGTFAGVRLRGASHFAVADPENGPRHEPMVPFHP